MMYAREKSDSAIVAGKPINKAERSATESVAKGGDQGECAPAKPRRTQSRISVTEALERVRKAASKSKQEKFTALFHHLSVELGFTFIRSQSRRGKRKSQRDRMRAKLQANQTGTTSLSCLRAAVARNSVRTLSHPRAGRPSQIWKSDTLFPVNRRG
jgi:hypothetical protein